MEHEDKQSLAQFVLMVVSATITYIVSINLEGTTSFKLFVILVLLFITFILYSSLIGRPWPRSYYKTLVCKGNESENNSFFWTFYDKFEFSLKQNLSEILEQNPKDNFAYLSLENNRLKIESEREDTLDFTCNLVKKIFKSNHVNNIEISKLNFQNLLIARPKMNSNFRASATKIIFATKLKLKDSDLEGIYKTSEILNLLSEGENAKTFFSWPEEKDFLLSKDQPVKTLKYAHKHIFEYLIEILESENRFYPIIRRQNIIIDEFDKDLVYYVTIDAKWRISFIKSLTLFKEAVNNFNEFLEIWNDIDTNAAVKYRFKNCVFSGLKVQDGINKKNYAKKITFFSEKQI